MRFRFRVLAGTLWVLLAAAAPAACGGDRASESAPTRVAGQIVELTRADGRIEGFTVQTDDGDEYELLIAEGVDYGFDLEHLDEHRRQRAPVACAVTERDGRLYALTIEDVP